MTSDRPPTPNCPRCGVAMVGRKADQRSTGHDTFECPLCRTVIAYEIDDRPAEPRRERREGGVKS